MILEILGSIVSGGATGLLGSAISGFTKYKTQKLEYEHDLKTKELDLQVTQMEIAGAERIAGIEAEGRISVADAQALTASYNADTATYTGKLLRNNWLFVFVDFIRGMVRPSLTIYLIYLVTMIYQDLQILMGDSTIFTSIEAVEVIKQVIYTILYITSTVVFWWFGTRNKTKPPK